MHDGHLRTIDMSSSAGTRGIASLCSALLPCAVNRHGVSKAKQHFARFQAVAAIHVAGCVRLERKQHDGPVRRFERLQARAPPDTALPTSSSPADGIWASLHLPSLSFINTLSSGQECYLHRLVRRDQAAGAAGHQRPPWAGVAPLSVMQNLRTKPAPGRSRRHAGHLRERFGHATPFK